MRKAIVHIGTHKTGSTSIQNFLDANRDTLKNRGIAFPLIMDRRNHFALKLYAAPENTRSFIKKELEWCSEENIPGFLQEFPGLFEEQINSFNHCHTFIFSAEVLGLLRQKQHLQKLHGLLAKFFDKIEIVAYLRRQDDLAISLYQQLLKGGNPRKNIFPKAQPKIFCFKEMLTAYAEQFGKQNISVRRFGHSGGGNAYGKFDVITDFCSVTDIDTIDLKTVLHKNQSLGTKAVSVLREYNQGTNDGTIKPLRRSTLKKVISLLKSLEGDSRLEVDQDKREAFLARFRDQNKWVSDNYFDGQPLFDMKNNRNCPTQSQELTKQEALEIYFSLLKQLEDQ